MSIRVPIIPIGFGLLDSTAPRASSGPRVPRASRRASRRGWPAPNKPSPSSPLARAIARIAAALVILVIVASSRTRILQYGRRRLRNAKNLAHGTTIAARNRLLLPDRCGSVRTQGADDGAFARVRARGPHAWGAGGAGCCACSGACPPRPVGAHEHADGQVSLDEVSG